MFLPKYKLKATIVIALTLIFGVGAPLLTRLQALNLGDFRTAIFGNNQSEIPGIQNVNNNSTQLFPVAPQSVTPQPVSTQQGNSSVGLECIATPATAYVGDQVTWQVKTSNIQSPEKIKYLWTGAVTGMGQTQTSSHSAPGVFTASVQFEDAQFGKKQATCSINVIEKTIQSATVTTSAPDSSQS